MAYTHTHTHSGSHKFSYLIRVFFALRIRNVYLLRILNRYAYKKRDAFEINEKRI